MKKEVVCIRDIMEGFKNNMCKIAEVYKRQL
jgi:hypothetical protein